MKTIGILLGSPQSTGGLERATILLANELSKKYSIVLIGFINYHKDNFYYIDKNIRVIYLNDFEISMSKFMLKFGWKKLRTIINKVGIDTLISSGSQYFLLGYLACKHTVCKNVSWEHSNPLYNKDHKFQKISRNLVSKKGDYLVVLTKKSKQIYETKYKSKTKIYQIYNFIDSNLFNFNPKYSKDNKKIITVGRLGFPKNYESIIEIAKKITNKNGWTWHIYGSGTQFETDKMEKLIRNNNLTDFIIMEGRVKEIYEKAYLDAGLFCLTSIFEGFPMVLLESCYFNVPMISFDINTGPSEIIEDGKNGYLIKPYDLDEMAAKIQKCINDDNIRSDMSINCKELIKPFFANLIINQWTQFLDDLK